MPNFVNVSLSVSVFLYAIENGCIQNHSKYDVAKLLEIICNDNFQQLVWKSINKVINAASTNPWRNVASTIIRNKHSETLKCILKTI